jgi:MFS family permease
VTIPADAAPPVVADTEPWPGEGQAWYAVAIFALALMVNFLDRGIVNLLVQPMKRDLDLTDVQISLLLGFAFVGFYVLLGLPIGRLVDSRSRRTIITVGVAIWSVTTALCGVAQNFWQFFACRLGVGIGEACTGPSTFSMIADLFPPAKLTRALSVLQLGLIGGAGLSMLLGAGAIEALSGVPDIHLPIIGTLHNWQLVFFAVGTPGLLVALLMTTIVDRKRRGRLQAAGTAGAVQAAIPIPEVARFLARNWTTYLPMFASLAVVSMAQSGNAAWNAAFFQRTYGWSPARFASLAGVIMLVSSPVGLFLGGWLTERLARRGRADANLRVMISSYVLSIPAGVLAPLMPTPWLALALMVPLAIGGAMTTGPQTAALQMVTPNEMRGQITALYLFVYNVVGTGLGATLVAIVTDWVLQSEADLRYALAGTSAIMLPLAPLVLWFGLKPYARSIARARSWA